MSAASRSSSVSLPLTLALFFASGVAGLIYQVMWVRGFGHVFGNTLSSAALVTAVFMCGLGVGSIVMGRFIDRRERHASDGLLFYGYAEVAIAAFGMLLAVVVPQLPAWVASAFDYSVDASGWHVLSTSAYAFEYTVAILALAPPCFLMGGTLTLLIRFVVAGEVTAAGWRVGLLFGVNTFGAAVGALLTDFTLVPRLGTFDTQLVAVGLNLVAGSMAVLAARRSRGARSTEGTPAQQEGASASYDRRLWLTCSALVLSGTAAMGLEILWFRYLSQLLGSLRSTFSLILAVMLVAMWLGSTLAGYLHRRFGHPALLLIVSQAAMVLSAAVLLGEIDHELAHHTHLQAIVTEYQGASNSGRAFIELTTLLRPIAVVTAMPAFAMGFVFPLANAHVQRTRASVGGSAGALYLAVTVGNVVGSLTTGFLLLPKLGIQATALTLLVCAGACVVPIYFSTRRAGVKRTVERLDVAFGAALTCIAMGIFAFALLPEHRLLQPCIPSDDEQTRRLVSVAEGPNETITVMEVFGLDHTLFTNGHPMSSTAPTKQRYMRAFAHLPLLQLDDPRSALIICFGVGNTAHAASLHPSIEQLHVADLSRNVLQHASWFSVSNDDVLTNERVSVFVNDGRLHLRMVEPGTYDLITLEPPPIMFAGVAALYSREFYALARERLTDRGFVTQWLPAYQVHRETVLAMVRAFVEVFPQSVLLEGSDKELILMGTKRSDIRIDAQAFEERMQSRSAVLRDLEAIRMGSLVEVLGSFAASSDTMRHATEGTAPVTDEHPKMEYSQLSGIRANELPSELFDVDDISAWCPKCLAEVPGLRAHLRIRGLIRQSSAYLRSGSYHRTDAPRAMPLPDDAEAQRAIAESPYLELLFGGPSFVPKEVAREHMKSGRLEEAISVLRRAVFLAPLDGAAHYELGLALHASGNKQAAEEQLALTLRVSPLHPRANAVMCRRAARAGRFAEAAERCDVAIRGGVTVSPEILAEIKAKAPRK